MFMDDDEEKKEDKPLFSKPSAKTKPVKRTGTIRLFLDKEIVVDVNGCGERIPFVEKEHGTLKVGDTIEVP